MRIAGLVKSSLIDFPDAISAVLFVPGCNYDCFYCHNRALISGGGPVLDLDSVMEFLKRRAGMLEGVVITGGEPTLQGDLPEFLKTLGEMGYRRKLDTNGSRPEAVRTVLDAGLCDYFAVDYKAPAARYAEFAGPGSSAAPVLETVGLLLGSGVPFEVRTTLAPGLGIGELLTMAGELPPLARYQLNAYRVPEAYRPEDFPKISQPTLSGADLLSALPALKERQPGLRI